MPTTKTAKASRNGSRAARTPSAESAPAPISMEDRIRRMRELQEKVKSSRTLAREVLLATGMYTPTGKLKKKYR